MKVIEKRQIGVTGARGDVPVFAEMFEVANGKYKVQVSESRKGGKKIPMEATGLPNEKLAWEMLDLFVESYTRSQEEDGKSRFRPVQSDLKAELA